MSTSSPLRPGADLKEQLDWYKAQYAQLEADLADFQASSKDLEEQLEKDVETAEKNERKWKEQVEKLNFEVDEWKTKHKTAKTEANTAQNALQKEITTMRDTNRTLQLQLRDTEVMNDDYERQARNTETSLEDMESKYNATIEREVLLEETIKQGEQEREELRIETQRLRDELSDLKVESEITLEKLRLAEETIEGLRARKPSSLAVENLRARSPASEASGTTPLSPTASTPPPKSDTASEAQTPPSPPLSDAPVTKKTEQKTPVPAKTRSAAPEPAKPRTSIYGTRTASRHSRVPSLASSVSAGNTTSDAKAMKPPSRTRPRPSNARESSLPRSDSLYQIRGLIGRMQKIEERVHNARSKLPAPNSTPRGSPRAGSALGDSIPSSVTVRRSSKRPSASRTSSYVEDSSIVEEDESATAGAAANGRRESYIKRLSYGIPRPASQATHRSDMPDRPPSALDRPPSVAASRPSSRASIASQSNPRPPSRSGARTELGHYAAATFTSTNTSTSRSTASRPRSSMGGAYSHRPSSSVSEVREMTTPARRSTLDRGGVSSALPTLTPTPSALNKSTGSGLRAPKVTPSRVSGGGRGLGEMRPPPSRKKASDVGETY